MHTCTCTFRLEPPFISHTYGGDGVSQSRLPLLPPKCPEKPDNYLRVIAMGMGLSRTWLAQAATSFHRLRISLSAKIHAHYMDFLVGESYLLRLKFNALFTKKGFFALKQNALCSVRCTTVPNIKNARLFVYANMSLRVQWVLRLLYQRDRHSRKHHLLRVAASAAEKPDIPCAAPSWDSLTGLSIVGALSTDLACEQRRDLLDVVFGGLCPGTGRSEVMLGS